MRQNFDLFHFYYTILLILFFYLYLYSVKKKLNYNNYFTLIMIKQDVMKINIKISFFINSLFESLFHRLNETWVKLINCWIALSSVKISFKFYIK